MNDNGQVHWHEGLFLQPHHLQTMQRHLLEKISGERRFSLSYPFGVVEMELSAEALRNQQVQFTRLRVVMRSGLIVDTAINAELPPLDIAQMFATSTEPFTILLGVPLWNAARGNSIEQASQDNWREKRLYRISTMSRPDENTGQNPQPMLVRMVNARLMFEDDNAIDMEVLPLIRVKHAGGDKAGLPEADRKFFPPAMHLNSCEELFGLVQALAQLVEGVRKDLVTQITNPGTFDLLSLQGPSLEQVLRLRILSRFSSILSLKIAAPGVSTFEIFSDLQELLAEMAALAPERSSEVFQLHSYNHESPAVGFYSLDDKIRKLLIPARSIAIRKIPFEAAAGYVVASLAPGDFDNAVYLGVNTKEDITAYRDPFVAGTTVKLMPASKWQMTVPGVKLEWDHAPPTVLPASQRYFKLVRTGEMWETARRDGRIAFRWIGKDTSSCEAPASSPSSVAAGFAPAPPRAAEPLVARR